MSRKRRIFSPPFKVKVAIEAIKGHRTISELTAKNKLHATQINLGKKQLLEDADGVFENQSGTKTKPASTDEPQAAELYEQIGRLKMHLERLIKLAEDGE